MKGKVWNVRDQTDTNLMQELIQTYKEIDGAYKQLRQAAKYDDAKFYLDIAYRKKQKQQKSRQKSSEGKSTMGKRSKVRKSKDAKIYNKTARKTKAINLSNGAMRGGIRL